MNMTELVTMIEQVVAIWGPSLAAIAGIIVAVLSALATIKKAFNELRGSNIASELNENTAKLERQLKDLLSQNEQLAREYQKLEEEITRVRHH